MTSFRSRVVVALGVVSSIVTILVFSTGIQNVKALFAKLPWASSGDSRSTEANRSGTETTTQSMPVGSASIGEPASTVRQVRNLLWEFKHDLNVTSIRWSPSGDLIAISGAGVGSTSIGSSPAPIALLDSRSGEKVDEIYNKFNVEEIDWSPDGRYIVGGSRWSAIVWDSKTGATVQEFPYVNAVDTVDWSPVASKIAGAYFNGPLTVWDFDGRGERKSLGNCRGVHTVAFSHSGEFIAAGTSCNSVEIISVASGEVTRTLPHGGCVTKLSWNPDDTLLATVSDCSYHAVLIWNTLTGGKVKIIAPEKEVFSLCWSPTGKYLALGGYGVRVIKAQNWSEVGGLPAGFQMVMSLAWNPDGSSIAIGRRDQVLSLVRIPWER